MIKAWILAALVAVSGAASAQASVFFEIERISDSKARFNGSGSIDADSFFQTVVFSFTEFQNLLATNSSTSSGSYAGDLAIGGTEFDGVFLGSNFGLTFETARTFSDGEVLSGSGLVMLSGATFAPVGTISDVAFNDGDGVAINVGSYEVIQGPPPPIPLPGTGLALIGGLAGLAALRRARS